MLDSRRNVLVLSYSTVLFVRNIIMLLLFSQSSKSDMCPFLFAVATAPASDSIHVSGIDRKGIIPHGGSTTSRILLEDQNRTLPSCESAEIILSAQYDLDTAMVRSKDPSAIIESEYNASRQVRYTNVREIHACQTAPLYI